MSGNDEINSQIYKNLLEQVFALAYYGRLDAAFISTLPTEDRHYLLKYLAEVKEKEEEEYKNAAKKAQANLKTPKIPKINPRIKL